MLAGSWAEAILQSKPKNLALTRFRIPWQWSGAPAMLQSRATDNRGQFTTNAQHRVGALFKCKLLPLQWYTELAGRR